MTPRRLSIAIALAGAAACSRKTVPVAAPSAPPPSYEVRLGHDVFVHYCSTCHGEAGAGDGFNAYNLDPHPRDISDPAFQKKKTDAELADTIRRGGAGVGLSSLMPPWGRTLSDRQVAEVVLYVRSLEKTAP
jgi:mono/diheme cytochrome c family protein